PIGPFSDIETHRLIERRLVQFALGTVRKIDSGQRGSVDLERQDIVSRVENSRQLVEGVHRADVVRLVAVAGWARRLGVQIGRTTVAESQIMPQLMHESPRLLPMLTNLVRGAHTYFESCGALTSICNYLRRKLSTTAPGVPVGFVTNAAILWQAAAHCVGKA